MLNAFLTNLNYKQQLNNRIQYSTGLFHVWYKNSALNVFQ
ncbi:hypothetical protein SAMN05216311_10548 [Chitinophaga sp. CF418]|nr:hypothetical protein SAMN05216311_10548 [Chitinophaga sp. CF418]